MTRVIYNDPTFVSADRSSLWRPFQRMTVKNKRKTGRKRLCYYEAFDSLFYFYFFLNGATSNTLHRSLFQFSGGFCFLVIRFVLVHPPTGVSYTPVRIQQTKHTHTHTKKVIIKRKTTKPSHIKKKTKSAFLCTQTARRLKIEVSRNVSRTIGIFISS